LDYLEKRIKKFEKNEKSQGGGDLHLN